MSILLEAKNICVSYEKALAVGDVSFRVEEGDYICVLGENGAGKSTLLKALLGLIPLKSGEILPHNIKPSQIGYLPQQTQVQKDFPASVREVILSGRAAKTGKLPFFRDKDRADMKAYVQMLNLKDILNRSYRELSGGQQQRVLLCRALLAAEKLLVLDEPAAGLDAVITHEFYHIVGHLNKEKKVAVIMVSHDIRCAVREAQHILHLKKEASYFGPSEDYVKTRDYHYLLGGCCDHA